MNSIQGTTILTRGDSPGVFKSVGRTGRLLALDTGFTTGSVTGEIVARVRMEMFSQLLTPLRRLAMPDMHEPTSPALTRGYYVRVGEIVNAMLNMLDKQVIDLKKEILESEPHDIAGTWFAGPF